MRELEAVFRCQLSPVVAAAVQSWSLLLSITPASRVPPLHTRYLSLPLLVHTHSHSHTHSQLPVLNDLLGSGDASVRVAVGQAVALLFELGEEREGEGEGEGAVSYHIYPHNI